MAQLREMVRRQTVQVLYSGSSVIVSDRHEDYELTCKPLAITGKQKMKVLVEKKLIT